jgi:hypothetical protein
MTFREGQEVLDGILVSGMYAETFDILLQLCGYCIIVETIARHG